MHILAHSDTTGYHIIYCLWGISYYVVSKSNHFCRNGGAVMFCPCLFCPSDKFDHCLALPTHWRASVCALSYWYLLCDPRRCDNNRYENMKIPPWPLFWRVCGSVWGKTFEFPLWKSLPDCYVGGCNCKPLSLKYEWWYEWYVGVSGWKLLSLLCEYPPLSIRLEGLVANINIPLRGIC